MEMTKAIVSCAITGVLTDPKTHPVPVTAKEMAQASLDAYNAGATIVHCHFRNQDSGKGHLPTWDPKIVAEICNEIKAKVPNILINMSTGVLGKDLSGPLSCLKEVKPEIAALNSGSLNYLKVKSNGEWAWKPMLFDNPVEKVQEFLESMASLGIVPECECFDTGIVRSLKMYEAVGLLKAPIHASFVMGVASGMPSKPSWLPLLIDELPEKANWQVIAIGREEVWDLHKEALKLGGHVRTGLEDTFYLPNGERAKSNGELVEALAALVRDSGRELAAPEDTKKAYHLS